MEGKLRNMPNYLECSEELFVKWLEEAKYRISAMRYFSKLELIWDIKVELGIISQDQSSELWNKYYDIAQLKEGI